MSTLYAVVAVATFSTLCLLLALLAVLLARTHRNKKGGKKACTLFDEWREDDATNVAEVRLMNALRAKANAFAAHLAAKHVGHPMADTLLAAWNGEVRLSTRATGATWKSGCMIINPYWKHPGSLEDPERVYEDRLVTRLLHEFAHSWSGPHDAKFYEAHRWFLRVATDELGWRCIVNCRICCFHPTPALCNPAACPKCTWETTTCGIGKRDCGAA